MGFRAVGTNDGTYVGIGGQNPLTLKPEDPTKKYVNFYVNGRNGLGTSQAPSVEVKYLMESLLAEGFIQSFTLPLAVVVDPLSQTERVAKAIMEANDQEKYTDAAFRDESDYEELLEHAQNLLKGNI